MQTVAFTMKMICATNTICASCGMTVGANHPTRVYICKATYEDGNQSLVDGLACLPAKVFGYAPNMFCLSDACTVHITRNINLGSGLVNGCVGRVIQVLYDHADVKSLLEGWSRKKMKTSLCYRQQFPLDLCLHMTCHRSQGQSLVGSVVNVDMNLHNPDKPVPNDITSIIYVPLTRVRQLKDLLVSPIIESAWEKIGKSEMDDRRRKVDAQLIKASGELQ